MKDKIAVVTAAGQGIGRATAEGPAKRGATVYALDSNPDTLKSITNIRSLTTRRRSNRVSHGNKPHTRSRSR